LLAVHCRAGGLLMICPDYIRENFVEACDIDPGGHDEPGRGMRYMEWHSEMLPTKISTPCRA
jgi:hypothetical protein